MVPGAGPPEAAASASAAPDGDDDELVAYCLDDWEVDLANEVLKVLFNLTVSVDRNNVDEMEEAHFLRLVSILHDLLVCDTRTKEKKEDLASHTVNLLTNMPPASFEELLSPVTELGKPDNPAHQYEEMNCEVIAILTDFLDHRLEADQSGQKTLRESLAPVLTCLSGTRKICDQK